MKMSLNKITINKLIIQLLLSHSNSDTFSKRENYANNYRNPIWNDERWNKSSIKKRKEIAIAFLKYIKSVIIKFVILKRPLGFCGLFRLTSSHDTRDQLSQQITINSA